ncbi:MAG: VOC family protein [Rhizobiaceae bacterium]|nr:VOC family protein [Rhizobiaceae bacterium]
MDSGSGIDHLVLPVADLDDAQRRYRALGFTVAPVGQHPFGTANCCVYFEDGTFLEPLAIADENAARTAIADGNAFVQGDANYRAHSGGEGLAGIVLATNDAKKDDARFRAAHITGGSILDFSRAVVDKAGRTGTASFRLAFARDPLSPAPFFFSCQRVKAPKVDRAALQHHRNAVTGLRGVILLAQQPHAHRGFLEAFFRTTALRESRQCLVFQLPNAEITVATPEFMAERWGIELAQSRVEGLDPVGVVFAATDIAALGSLFNADSIAYLARGNALVAPPATGQGATFIFEASS